MEQTETFTKNRQQVRSNCFSGYVAGSRDLLSVFFGFFCWNFFDCRFCLYFPVWCDNLLDGRSCQISLLVPFVLYFNASFIRLLFLSFVPVLFGWRPTSVSASSTGGSGSIVGSGWRGRCWFGSFRADKWEKNTTAWDTTSGTRSSLTWCWGWCGSRSRGCFEFH